MVKHRTMRGTVIDIDALRMQHQHEPALGNARMNARGDIIGEGGKIVRTREQIVEEYYHTNDRMVKHVNVKQDRQQMFSIPNAPLLADGTRATAGDPNFFKKKTDDYSDIEFKTPEQVIMEAKERQEQARAAMQAQEKNKIATEALVPDDIQIEAEAESKPKSRRKVIDKD